MHHHLEVILPPTDDIKIALAKILKPFDQNQNDAHAFWDWYRIGGRYSGAKLTHGLDLDSFYAELKKRNVTVSAVTMGKGTLQPESQIAMVDALWRDFFPNCPITVCPLFDHYEGGIKDVMTLAETPKELKMYRLIVAGPNHKAHWMQSKEIWNGCNYEPTAWNGALGTALAACAEHTKNYKPEYAAKMTPRDDWAMVTVDYHS